MAHHFLHAPRDYSVEEAIRWGQVMGLGGNSRLVETILSTRIATDFSNDDFWGTVIRWFAQNLGPSVAMVGPLVDYIYRRKYRPHDPDFSMKGRTVGSLVRQMLDWHTRLREARVKEDLQWPASGIQSFDWTENSPASNTPRHWTIIELLSRHELHHEGQVMRHCVASYDDLCARGTASIWSMGLQKKSGHRRHVLTIEVTNRTRTIRQIRGKANRLPRRKEMNVVQRWASEAGLSLARHTLSC
jgi:hypothetical protein